MNRPLYFRTEQLWAWATRTKQARKKRKEGVGWWARERLMCHLGSSASALRCCFSKTSAASSLVPLLCIFSELHPAASERAKLVLESLSNSCRMVQWNRLTLVTAGRSMSRGSRPCGADDACHREQKIRSRPTKSPDAHPRPAER